jgi:hypothetical protein
MNEDPTRLMDYDDEPPRRRRPPQQPKGNLRLVVLVMGVVIFGLLIGLIASCGGGETKTVTQTRTIIEEVPAKTPEKATEGEGEGEEGEEGEGSEESAEEQELREIEEAEAAEAETGGIEEAEPTQEELELQEIEEAEAAEEGQIFEEAEGGGVGAE